MTMFKAALVLVTALVFVNNANAISLPQFWVADGYREVTAANTGSITYLPFKVENLDSQSRCESLIDEQNAITVGRNIKGYAGTQRVVATCSQQR